MLIRCYGARGSIPVSGSECLVYGGDTTCLEVRSAEDDLVIVDAGSGIRRLGEKLAAEGRREFNLLFTHSHWDHILGFPFFKPVYLEGVTISLLGCPTAQGNIKKLLSRTMVQPYFPIPFDQLKATIDYSDECSLTFRVGSLEITPINLSHPNIGMGFKFEEAGKSFVFLTDNELGYAHRGGRDKSEYIDFAAGADLLVHDAQYTPEEYAATRSWGHSTYIDALALATAARARRFGLFHHDPARTDAGVDKMVRHCRQIVDEAGMGVDCFAVTQDSEFII